MTKFKKETDLCAEFMKLVPAEWTVYPETGGFDILVVRKIDGFQIGIEAKLKLNAKVICQAAERVGNWYGDLSGPDCRAVLIPADASGDLGSICHLLGIEIIRVHREEQWSYRRAEGKSELESHTSEFYRFDPYLPSMERDGYGWGAQWQEFFPVKRIPLPDYVPDTIAGDKCPIQLTSWKIGAMRLAVLLEKTGFLTRKDFNDLKISVSRWTQGGITAWLRPGAERGIYVKGSRFPDFSAQHPVNYKQIEADFDDWNPRDVIGPAQKFESAGGV